MNEERKATLRDAAKNMRDQGYSFAGRVLTEALDALETADKEGYDRGYADAVRDSEFTVDGRE